MTHSTAPATGMTAVQMHVLQTTGMAMSHKAALAHLSAEAASARAYHMRMHRLAGTISPEAAALAAARAAEIEQGPRQIGCTAACKRGQRCACLGAPRPELSPRPARTAPTALEQHASDFGALDLQHREDQEPSAGDINEQMRPREALAARVYRWAWRGALVAAAAIWLAGCGGGSPEPEPEPAQLVPAIATTSRAHATAAPLAEVWGDSTMVRIYPDQVGDAVAYADIALGQPLINSAVSGSTADSVTPERIAASSARNVVMNWGINDTDLSTPDRYRLNLTRLAVAARLAGKTAVLLESTPIVPGGRVSSHRSEPLRRDFEVIKRQVAVDTGAYYCALPAKTWTLADKPDGVHEHDAAAQWKGRALADCLTRATETL